MQQWVYSSTYSSPRYWIALGSLLHAPAALFPENEPPTRIEKSTDWVPQPVCTMWVSKPDFSAINPEANLCTDWAIPAFVFTDSAEK
jgi:hypothetical protein